jgi:ABC-type polysaccharide/polyol phosphate export permease
MDIMMMMMMVKDKYHDTRMSFISFFFFLTALVSVCVCVCVCLVGHYEFRRGNNFIQAAVSLIYIKLPVAGETI